MNGLITWTLFTIGELTSYYLIESLIDRDPITFLFNINNSNWELIFIGGLIFKASVGIILITRAISGTKLGQNLMRKRFNFSTFRSVRHVLRHV